MNNPSTEDDENEYFKITGQIVHFATMADSILAEAFGVIAECNPAVSGAIYYTLDAITAKEKLVTRVAKLACDDEERALIREIIAAVKIANNQRTEVAHSMIAQGKPPTRYKPRHNTHKPITRPYLDTLLTETLTALNRADRAYRRLLEKRGIPQEEPF